MLAHSGPTKDNQSDKWDINLPLGTVRTHNTPSLRNGIYEDKWLPMLLKPFLFVLYFNDTMVCSKGFENINIKMDDYALKQVSKFKYLLGSTITEDGQNRKDVMQRIREAKVMFNNKKQLLCSNNLSLEMKKTLIKSCI
jgi:hypothetical protein